MKARACPRSNLCTVVLRVYVRRYIFVIFTLT